MTESKYEIIIKKTVEQEVEKKLKRDAFASLIDRHYSLADIENELIYPLGADKGNLPGQTKIGKAQALVEWCANRGRLQELWYLCNETRLNTDWESALEDKSQSPTPQVTFENIAKEEQETKTSARKNWLKLLLVGFIFILGGIAGLYLDDKMAATASVGWLVPPESDYTVYDFEECANLGQDWQVDPSSSEPLACEDDIAFTGQRSLAVPIQVQERANTNSPVGTTQLWLLHSDLTHKLLHLRVYVPSQAPQNLAAHLLVVNEEGKYFGPLVYLRPGSWNSMIWFIRAYEELGSPQKMGIEFKLEGHSSSPEPSQYDGLIYLDAVEIYTTAP